MSTQKPEGNPYSNIISPLGPEDLASLKGDSCLAWFHGDLDAICCIVNLDDVWFLSDMCEFVARPLQVLLHPLLSFVPQALFRSIISDTQIRLGFQIIAKSVTSDMQVDPRL